MTTNRGSSRDMAQATEAVQKLVWLDVATIAYYHGSVVQELSSQWRAGKA